METKIKSNYSTPIAIIIAGVIIGGALYFSDSPKLAAPKMPVNPIATGLSKIRAINTESHILGNPNAEIVILEYSDTECPFCKMFQKTMQSVVDNYGKDGKVAWVYRHFPLDSLHKKSRKEAEATECANELGGNTAFWKMLDTIYERTPANDGLDLSVLPEFAKEIGLDVASFNSCLESGKYSSLVEADYQDGILAGARGTPYSVMILKTALDSETKNKLDEYVTTTNLFDRSGEPLVYVSTDNQKIVTSGALSFQIIKSIIDIVLK